MSIVPFCSILYINRTLIKYTTGCLGCAYLGIITRCYVFPRDTVSKSRCVNSLLWRFFPDGEIDLV